MQDNQEILEGSQSKLRRDMLNNSFSDLEDNHEDDNLEIKKVGEIPKFDFKPKEHFELGQILKLQF